MATYRENLIIPIRLNLIGSDARTTFIDGGLVSHVIAIYTAGIHVTLSEFTVQNGKAAFGGGIHNYGTLTINNSTIRRNIATSPKPYLGRRGGIYSQGTLTINNSTISGNSTNAAGGISAVRLTTVVIAS